MSESSAFLTTFSKANELHNNTYGEKFYQELLEYIEKGFISQEDASEIVQCLVDIDEIRMILSEKIKSLIYYTIMIPL